MHRVGHLGNARIGHLYKPNIGQLADVHATMLCYTVRDARFTGIGAQRGTVSLAQEIGSREQISV